jgi:hypothetical protein
MACATLLRVATMCGIYYVNNVLNQDRPVLSPQNVVGITYSNHVTLFNNMAFANCFVNRSNPVLTQQSQQVFLNNDHPVIYNKNLVFYDIEKDDHLKMIRMMKENDKKLEAEEKRRMDIQDKFDDYRKTMVADSKRSSIRFKKELARREHVEAALADLKKKKAATDAIKNQLLAKEKKRLHELEEKLNHISEEKKKHALEHMKQYHAEQQRRLLIEKALTNLKKKRAQFKAEKKKLLEREKSRYVLLSHKLKQLEQEKKRHDAEQSAKVRELEKEKDSIQGELQHAKKNMEIYRVSNEKLFHKEKARYDDLAHRWNTLQTQKKKHDAEQQQKLKNEEEKRVLIEKALRRLRRLRKKREYVLKRRIRRERELREELEERLRKILKIQEHLCEDHHDEDKH